jgi:hypothetical protein
MSEALAPVRQRYEATPRVLDDELVRMARGDRGCLGDALAGAGGLGTIVFGVLASFDVLGWGFMIGSLVSLVVGFMLSAAAQARSAPLRRRAITEGPLVYARVVQADAALYEPGDAVLPARVVYSADAARRFDGAWLQAVGQRLQALARQDAPPPEHAAAWAVLREPSRVETVRLGRELAGEAEVYLSVVAVDQRRLPGRRIEGGEVALIVDPRSGFAEHV